MRQPVITLTTDFGLSDHYVGVMKGVILSIVPHARIVDITHELPAYEPLEAAYTIEQAYRWFPKKTVHVAVVDPGVGSTRRPILMEAAGQYFVGPDNGIFTLVAERETHKVREITTEKFFLKPVSRTFHGRDVFAPVAAHLAKGITPARFGKPVDNYLRLGMTKPQRTARRAWTGMILRVDRFGNLVTNFHVDDFGKQIQQKFDMAVGMTTVGKLATSYAECAPGEVFVIVGSGGYLEISANKASAAKLLGCAAGAPAELTIY
jgi:S-adenosylmethionine hydrolase